MSANLRRTKSVRTVSNRWISRVRRMDCPASSGSCALDKDPLGCTSTTHIWYRSVHEAHGQADASGVATWRLLQRLLS
jgi:hypothetical protein